MASAMDNVYLELTREFNRGRTHAVISSGQAVVMHRLAIMSKDGDWILREEDEALDRVREVLQGRAATYRFGAPLDRRWLASGWSAHLEFRSGPLRVRTDFVTRPPRLSPEELEALWRRADGDPTPFLGLRELAEIKRTDREKDYAVIGELALRMTEPRDRFRHSRSARDLLDLAERFPDLAAECARERPALEALDRGRDTLEAALDAERRRLMRANEERLARYARAARAWTNAWPSLARSVEGLSLDEAHRRIVAEAERLLPFEPER